MGTSGVDVRGGEH